MGRMSSSRSGHVEEIEGDLALLGNSLVYLGLVTERIYAVMNVVPQQSLLSPAVDDLRQASCLIRDVQERVSHRLVSSPAAMINSELSREKNHKVNQTGLYPDGRRKKGRRS